MKSLKNLYIVGKGPSSSHTIGPMRAAEHFKNKIIELKPEHIVITLFGSFSLTYEGHGTDKIIKEVLCDYDVTFKLDKKTKTRHPNTMKMTAYKGLEELCTYTYESIGGGVIICLEDSSLNDDDIYPFKNFEEIKKYLKDNKLSHVYELVDILEDKDINTYLEHIFDTMLAAVDRGLSKEGKIRAGKTLWVDRSAKKMFESINDNYTSNEIQSLKIASYAYAVSEENATGNIVVTAPTCGSSGIIPATLYYLYHDMHVDKALLIRGLKTAGVIGNIFKQNATIAGAVGGCQAEIGVAVCMATSLLCSVNNLSLYQLEYGVELAMEHHLGLTCDPLDGYVVIPCIERNAVGAVRAFESYLFAKTLAPIRKNIISLDDVVETMKNTGHDIPKDYRETSLGGLAKLKK